MEDYRTLRCLAEVPLVLNTPKANRFMMTPPAKINTLIIKVIAKSDNSRWSRRANQPVVTRRMQTRAIAGARKIFDRYQDCFSFDGCKGRKPSILSVNSARGNVPGGLEIKDGRSGANAENILRIPLMLSTER